MERVQSGVDAVSSQCLRDGLAAELSQFWDLTRQVLEPDACMDPSGGQCQGATSKMQEVCPDRTQESLKEFSQRADRASGAGVSNGGLLALRDLQATMGALADALKGTP